jgi:hypothetical protein
MRVFTNKWFSRWADDEELSDSVLWATAKDVVTEYVEGSLGGCLFKKRIPREGGGKRSGYRVIIGYRKSDGSRVVFLYAFAIKDKANISNKEKTALQLTAKDFLSATDKQLQALLSTMKYREVTAHEQDS